MYARSDRLFADSLLQVTKRMRMQFMLMYWYITHLCLSDTHIHTCTHSCLLHQEIIWSAYCAWDCLFKPLKTKCVCFIQGHSAYCTVNVLRLGYTKPVSFTFWHRSFTFNSNKSPTWCNSFSVYYPDVCLQLNMFRAFSRPSSGAQWLQWQPLVLPLYRGDSRAVFVVGFLDVKPGGTYSNCWALNG
jgi:hypothetical protein